MPGVDAAARAVVAPRRALTAPKRQARNEPALRMAGQQSLFRGMLVNSAWFALCRALGLVKQIWFAALFGLSAQLDTYLFALNIAALTTLLSFGWLTSVSTIYLAKTRVTLGLDACLRRAAALTCLVLAASATLVAVVGLAAPALSRLATGFDEAQRAAVAAGMLLLLPLVGFEGVAGIMTATLKATRRFSAIGQSEFAASATALLVLWLWRGHPHVLFFAASAGAAAKVLVQSVWVAPMLAGRRPSAAGAPAFFRRYLLLLALPAISSAAAATHNAVLSHLPSGGIAALHFAAMFAMLATGMFNANVGMQTALHEQRSRGMDAVNKLWNDSISLAIVHIVPLIVFAGFCGGPLTSLVLERGQFDAPAAETVGALLALSFTLALHAKIRDALDIVLRSRAIIAPIVVSVGLAASAGLLARLVLALGLGLGARGMLIAQIAELAMLIAALAWTASRHGLRLATASHARWIAWTAACCTLAAAPLWLLARAWPLPSVGVLFVGAVYLAGIGALIWQYRGTEKALLEHYAQRLLAGARAALRR